MRRFWFILFFVLAANCAISTFADKAAHVNPKYVKQELKQILSAPEYNRTYEKEKEPFWVKKLRPVWKTLFKAFEWLVRSLVKMLGFDGEGVGKTISTFLACVVIAAFLILVFLIIRKIVRRLPTAKDDDETHRIESFQLLSEKPLIREAEKLAQEGDYRGAFRCAYLASISHLDEVKAIRFERSRTNWEYMRELRAGGHDSPLNALRPLTVDFDRKFYGGEECTSADYHRAVAVYESIASEVAA